MINDNDQLDDHDGHDDHHDCDIDCVCGGGGNKELSYKIQIWDHLLAQDIEEQEDADHEDDTDDNDVLDCNDYEQ